MGLSSDHYDDTHSDENFFLLQIGMISGGFLINQDTMEYVSTYTWPQRRQAYANEGFGPVPFPICSPYGINDARYGGCVLSLEVPFRALPKFGGLLPELCRDSC